MDPGPHSGRILSRWVQKAVSNNNVLTKKKKKDSLLIANYGFKMTKWYERVSEAE